MQNIRPMRVEWPLRVAIPQYIDACHPVSRGLMLKNQPYVLVRRFSTKEQPHRLIAAPYNPAMISNTEYIGIENHLNFITHPRRELSWAECMGLAGLLNTRLLDTYIRCRCGSTQVNATDLYSMPMPSWRTIRQIGEALIDCEVISNRLSIVEAIVQSHYEDDSGI